LRSRWPRPQPVILPAAPIPQRPDHLGAWPYPGAAVAACSPVHLGGSTPFEAHAGACAFSALSTARSGSKVPCFWTPAGHSLAEGGQYEWAAPEYVLRHGPIPALKIRTRFPTGRVPFRVSDRVASCHCCWFMCTVTPLADHGARAVPSGWSCVPTFRCIRRSRLQVWQLVRTAGRASLAT
jgi:hypothetical protein